MRSVYLDNSATTRISDEALKKYNEVSLSNFANPSSLHSLGFEAEKEMKEARAAVLRAIGDPAGTLVFTGSGSEANNLALIGRAYAKERYRRGAKIITTKGEHASVGAPLERLSREGFRIVEIETKGGVIDMAALERELSHDVILVSVMLVNNETGALYDVRAVSDLVKKKCPDAVVHTDATQAFLKVPFSPASLGADLITVSSHKIEGPKGVGALYISPSVIRERGISPIVFGGGQEGGLRSGTENVPAIAAFSVAASLTRAELGRRVGVMRDLRAYLLERLSEEAFSEILPTLPPVAAPHILNITLPSIKSETMLHYLSSRGICVSSGSACSSNGAHHPSPALVAFGRSEAEADCSLRVSFSHRNTREDVDALCDALAEGLLRLARIKK